MANAAAVSRLLAAAGARRAEYWPSAAVRGWGTQTSGFKCSQRPDATVVVAYVVGDDQSGVLEHQKLSHSDHELRTLTRKLATKYDAVHIEGHATDRDTFVLGWIVVRDK